MKLVKSVHSLFDKSNANKVIGDQVGLTKIIIDLLSNVKSKQLMLRESGLFLAPEISHLADPWRLCVGKV